jgi:hypothetical protein
MIKNIVWRLSGRFLDVRFLTKKHLVTLHDNQFRNWRNLTSCNILSFCFCSCWECKLYITVESAKIHQIRVYSLGLFTQTMIFVLLCVALCCFVSLCVALCRFVSLCIALCRFRSHDIVRHAVAGNKQIGLALIWG